MFHLGLSENIPMAEVKRPSVRRRLPFTDPDPQKTAVALDTQEKEIMENEANRFKEQWDFDVLSGEPVQGGKFEYSVMDPATAPAFYFKSYAPRKSRHVRRSPTPVDERSYDLFNVVRIYPRPQSAKRKLDLDLSENDENQDVLSDGNENEENQVSHTEPLWNANVQSRLKGSSAKQGTTSSVSSPSSPSNFTDGQSRLCDSSVDDSNGFLSRSTSSPSLSLSPATKEKDIVTPPTRSKSLTAKQSTIKDFLPLHKKPRISTKALPRP